VYGGSPDFYLKQLDWAQQARPADVQAAARRWLSDGVFVLEVQPVPDYQVAQSGADRSKLPATGKPPALELPPLQRATLSNGLKVVLAERHNAPVVQLQLIADAGYAADSQASPGTAKLAMAMLDEGTTRRDALEIAARAESLGATLGVGSSLDVSFIGLNALSARLGDSLELFSDVLLNPSFPEEELGRLKAQTLAVIQQEKVQPGGIATRLFPGLVYGEGHAYSNPFSGNGTEQSVTRLSRGELRTFYETWVRPDNATLLIVGDTTLATVMPLLEKYLGGWRAPQTPAPTKNVASAPAARPQIFLVNRPAAEQSMILAGYAGPSRSDPQYIGLLTLNTVLGGNFVSRLNMNLREEKHWSYGAVSQLLDAEGPGPFLVRAPVQTDKTADAMKEIVRELQEIRAGRPPTEEEIRFARDSLVLTLPGSNETAAEVANSIAEILIYGLPDTYWNDFVRDVNSVTSQQLQSAGAKLIRPEALTWVIVGDLAKIETEVRALGLGEVKVLDPDGKVLR
jgi:zinc protease